MSAFARGMQLGQQAWNTAEESRIRQEELGLKKAKDARDAELHGMTMDEKRRAIARDNELSGLRTEIADFTGGVNRSATNAALDADFEAANQAALKGMPLPKMAAPSNAANEAALTVRAPVDTTSPEFQQGLAGLRARYALASGDMRDFDAVTAAERTRVANQQDAEWARLVVADPAGELATQARTYINDFSRSLAIDPPDPKTGMSTLRIVRGDRTKPIDLPPADLAKVAVGVRRLQRGDVGGLDVISSVNKDLATAAAAEFNIDLSVAGKNNEVAKAGSDYRLRERQVNQTGEYYRGLINARKEADAQSAAADDYQRKVDGVMEGYQAAVASGSKDAAAIYASEYDQLRATAPKGVRVPPSIQALSDAQKSGVSKPVKVEDPGVIYRNEDGTLFATDGLGGRLAVNNKGQIIGVPPQERAVRLAEAGIPPEAIDKVRWSNGGEAVLFRGMEFNPNDPVELRALRATAIRSAKADQEVEAAQQEGVTTPRRGLQGANTSSGFGPRITYTPDPRAPSIHAGPEEWAEYYLLQKNR